MRRKRFGLLKAILASFLVIGLVLFIREKLRPQVTIAIVHNNQNISQIEYPIAVNDGMIYEINTDQYSMEEIENGILFGAHGVIFAGGNDFDPALYGGNRDLVEDFDMEDDQKSLAILKEAIEKEVTVLGICRGEQLINIYYGGSLYDDIEVQYGRDISHRGENKALVYHETNVERETKLGTILETDKIYTNSLHHEAVKDLADGLVISAKSDDGIIEAIENPYHPYMIGVQWHPEISYQEDEISQKLIDDFMAYCHKTRK